MVKIFKADDIVTVIEDSSSENNTVKSAGDLDNSLTEEMIKNAKIQAENIISKAKTVAEEIIENAQKEVLTVLKDAESRAMELFEEAKANGYKQGMLECQNEINKKLSAAGEKANEIVQEAHEERNRIFHELGDEILSLALSISEKVIKIELDRNDEAFKSILASAIKKVADDNNLKVRVSDSDYKRFLSEGREEIFTKSGNVTFIKDKLLKKGDCIVESDSGTIDAGINTQLKQVKLAFGVNA